MTTVLPDTHAFIVRVWLEPREIVDAEPELRGMIEHVSTRQREYFQSADVVVRFISRHMEQVWTRPRDVTHL